MNVIVHYRSDGNGKLKTTYPVVQEIRYFYYSGKVCTITGDVWEVRKTSSPEADYVALMA